MCIAYAPTVIIPCEMKPLVDKNGEIAYFGRLSWGNAVDWCVTIVLGLILIGFTLGLGAVRPETHVYLLPLFALLLFLHGIWLAVDDVRPKRISHIPILFLPLIGWFFLSMSFISPAAWLGRVEFIYTLEAFIFFWVASNNVRNRSHQMMLLIMAVLPLLLAIAGAVFQLTQDPAWLADAFTGYKLNLSPVYIGQSTGFFADPSSFATFLLLLLPGLLIAAMVRRFSVIQRVFCYSLVTTVLLGLLLAQEVWALMLFIPICLCLIKIFAECTRRMFLKFLILGALGMFLIFWYYVLRTPLVAEPAVESWRSMLWLESLRLFSQHPVIGLGAGALGQALQQSATAGGLPAGVGSPPSGFLLLFSQYGLVGGLCCLAPLTYTCYHGFKRWEMFPALMDLGRGRRSRVPFERFILSVCLAGFLMFLLSAFCSFIFYVPALLLYGLLFLSILVKYGFLRRCHLPHSIAACWSYFAFSLILAAALMKWAPVPLNAEALEQAGSESLNEVVAQGLHLSSDPIYINQVLSLYHAAVQCDGAHADAWIGLSYATCQLHYSDTVDANLLSAEAIDYAQRAIEISPDYSAAWAQLAVAQMLSGAPQLAERSLGRALELAPHDRQVHCLNASFLSQFPERIDEALVILRRLLQQHPNDSHAQYLLQRLLVL